MQNTLVAVFADQKPGHFRFQIAIAGMNGGSQCRFRRTSLADSFQNSLQITGAVGLADVLYRSQ